MKQLTAVLLAVTVLACAPAQPLTLTVTRALIDERAVTTTCASDERDPS